MFKINPKKTESDLGVAIDLIDLLNNLKDSLKFLIAQSSGESTLPAKVSISATMGKVKKSIERYNTILSNKPDLSEQCQEQVNELLEALEQNKENLEKFLRKRESSLKRQNTDQTNEVAKKKRKAPESIQRLIDILSEPNSNMGIDKLIEIRKFITYTIDKLGDEESDYKNEICKKLKTLEKKLQEVGKSQLEKLLYEADSSNLTDNKKREILDHIETLVKKAKIEFPENLVQKIPGSIIFEVTDIITAEENGPNSQLNSETNVLANGSSYQR